MNGLNRLRSSFRPSRSASENAGQIVPEGFAILNPSFSSYERFDLSTSTREQVETSLQTLHDGKPASSIHESTESTGSSSKTNKRTLRTIPGVFCPVALSMFSISIFMRLGFVLAHAGVLQTLLQFGLCFVILFCTLLSVCSLATNGAIEGGGVYHMISRALGPEFGGSIGVLFFFANVIGNGQSVAALVEALVELFGSGSRFNFFHGSRWWRFLYGTCINTLSLATCLLGSSLFTVATSSIFILVIFVFCTVLLSFFLRDPHLVLIPTLNNYVYHNEALLFNRTDLLYGHYTGFSAATFRENTHANYTIDYTTGETMSFEKIFGILFSSITGLLAGANMSGTNYNQSVLLLNFYQLLITFVHEKNVYRLGYRRELKRPSRSIPTGSIAALLFVFLVYVTEILLIAGTTSRDVLLNYYLFLPDINVWYPFVVIGIIAAVFSACLSGLVGASRILKALSVDEIFGPLLRWIQIGTTRRGNPMIAVFFTFCLVELTLLIGSMNAIAPIVTIFFLLAYFAVNLSCLALDLASAPNFRPTFKYFSWHTALVGAVGSIIMCFIVSPAFASVAIGILLGLLAMLHLRDFPRASWGSISQALIFHQVRKYLLLLDPRKEHVKFWRPQMLLLVASPRSSITLIDAVNDMKKGGLFIVGHVKTSESGDGSTDICADEYPHWVSLIDHMKIKAFVDMTSATNIRDGALHLMRLSGLGGLRPNTVILGFYDDVVPEDHLRTRPFFKRLWLKSNSAAADTVRLHLDENPTSVNGGERSSVFAFPELRRASQLKRLNIQSYVQIIQDALNLNKSVCLAKNFHLLNKEGLGSSKRKVFVDIWPVNFIFPESANHFDVTCLYMLQLATILSMVQPWKSRAILRVFLCIDAISDNAVRTQRNLEELLNQLRINAQTRIIAWENVTSLYNQSPSTAGGEPATISVQTQSSMETEIGTAKASFFADVNDAYIRGVNELIRQQCDNTSCVYFYLPRPARDNTLSSRYIRVLDMLSTDLPPTMFVHGVSSVTCTQL